MKNNTIMCECCTIKLNKNDINIVEFNGSDFHDKHIVYKEYLCNDCHNGIVSYKTETQNNISCQG